MILMSFDCIKNYANQPHQNGVWLLNTLALSDAVTLYGTQDKPYMDYWLALHGVESHSNVISENRDLDVWVPSKRPRMVVAADPSEAAWATSYGIPALVVCHSKLTLSSHLPGAPSWQEMVDELNRQKGIEPPSFESEDIGFE